MLFIYTYVYICHKAESKLIKGAAVLENRKWLSVYIPWAIYKVPGLFPQVVGTLTAVDGNEIQIPYFKNLF